MVGSATTFVPAHYLLSFLFLGSCDLLLAKCGVKGGHWFALHALGNFYITVSRRPYRAAAPPRRRAPAPPRPHAAPFARGAKQQLTPRS